MEGLAALHALERSMKTISLDELFWHDSLIDSVSSDPEDTTFDYRVEYPVDWEANRFEMRTIRFCNTTSHEIDEIEFAGRITILDATEFSCDGLGVELKTNAGTRRIQCSHMESDAEA